MATAQRDEAITLARFARTNRETGNPEELRVTTGDFNGRQVTSIRLWYRGKPGGPGDDGWRPTRSGITVREHELDEAIGALQEAARIVRDYGRSTASAPRTGTAPRGYQGPPSRPQARREPARPLLDRNRPPATIPGVDFDEFDDGEAGR